VRDKCVLREGSDRFLLRKARDRCVMREGINIYILRERRDMGIQRKIGTSVFEGQGGTVVY